jgi:hypothetical protein
MLDTTFEYGLINALQDKYVFTLVRLCPSIYIVL